MSVENFELQGQAFVGCCDLAGRAPVVSVYSRGSGRYLAAVRPARPNMGCRYPSGVWFDIQPDADIDFLLQIEKELMAALQHRLYSSLDTPAATCKTGLSASWTAMPLSMPAAVLSRCRQAPTNPGFLALVWGEDAVRLDSDLAEPVQRLLACQVSRDQQKTVLS